MTESRTTDEQAEKPDVHSFGERLYAARTRQGLSVEEVASAVNLTIDIIEAIDRSDVSHLPQPTFVQGYIRVYARQVGVPEDIVLEEYSRAVPHKLESELRPRNVRPDETNSGSPAVKIVSMLLLVAIVLAAVYGAYSYYSNAVEDMSPAIVADVESELAIPFHEFSTDQPASSVEQGDAETFIAEEALPEEELSVEIMPDQELIETQAVPVVEGDLNRELVEREAGLDTERAAFIKTQPVAAGNDVLVLNAQQSSWVEVVDANNVQMYYDLMQPEKTVTLKGTAPFDVFLGNAPAMEVLLNDVSLDISKFIRSNNIAHVKVSMQDGRVVFH